MQSKNNTIWGYCRISRKQQSIERQIRNILREYPDAVIYQEAFTGRSMNRPEWQKIYKGAKSGDTIVFDSVSRMSRNAEEGVKTYFEFLERGVSLVFLKEHYIDTKTYQEHTSDRIPLTGSDEDEIFKGLNNYFRKLAIAQIKIAFAQSEKEVEDLRRRTAEGILTAKLNGKQIGHKKGSTFTTKKSLVAKEIIKKHSQDFNGSLKDPEVIKLSGVSRHTYYKYKAELRKVLSKD